MPLLAEILFWIAVFAIGASVFSFLNVVIYRTPRKLSFVKGFSFCPACGHRLRGWELTPVLGWLFVKGRCRYCQAKISPRYPLVEMLGGCLALLCIRQFANDGEALTVFAFFAVLTVIAFIDIDTLEIPNGAVLAAALIGVVSIFTVPEIELSARFFGIFSVSVPLLLLALLIKGAFGGGDIKLMAACGLLLGWKLSYLALFFAILGGGIYGIWLLATHRKGRKEQFAFGPFLCLGMAASLFWGEQFLGWYLGFFA